VKVAKRIARLYREDSGVSAVEYAMMLSLIGAGLVAAVLGLGSQVGTKFNDAATVLQG